MKWWIYQRERFPLFKHGLLVLAFSGSAVTYASLATQTGGRWDSFLVAFISCLLFLGGYVSPRAPGNMCWIRIPDMNYYHLGYSMTS